MKSSEIIKKRLSDLKRMSVELKDSTQNNSNVDFNLIQTILSSTKPLDNKQHEESTPTSHQNSNKDLPIFKMLAEKMSPSPMKEFSQLLPSSNSNNKLSSNSNIKPFPSPHTMKPFSKDDEIMFFEDEVILLRE
eukprot:GHVR01026317.1.p1 GENE.GHVR01026317.1~~GHVR01026317.1.p1  ORF type:complete len:134 (+),score=9.81 GHVR01026317.1:1410-1811(+)